LQLVGPPLPKKENEVAFWLETWVAEVAKERRRTTGTEGCYEKPQDGREMGR
jgi:hypothetical protein